MCHSGDSKPSVSFGPNYKELTLSPWKWEDPSSSSIPLSDITSKEYLNILLSLVRTSTITLSSLQHQWDLSLYIWVQVDTIWISTPEESWILQTSDFLFWWASFHPHLPGHYSIHGSQRYLLRCTSALIHRVITLRSITRRTMSVGGQLIRQGGNIIDWEFVDPSVLE